LLILSEHRWIRLVSEGGHLGGKDISPGIS
jgi:hypothetical protein